MRRFLLLLLLLIQLNKSCFVKAKEDVISPEKETKTSEKSENETSENGKKDKDEEDSCLSSPCGSHARCKNVEVKCAWDIVQVHIKGLKKHKLDWCRYSS